jgi:DNA-binding CsgD family transcriptional regulator
VGLREWRSRAGLDNLIGFDYNVWHGTYLSGRDALACGMSFGLMLLYLLAVAFGNAGGLDEGAHTVLRYALALSMGAALVAGAWLGGRFAGWATSPRVQTVSCVATTVCAGLLAAADFVGGAGENAFALVVGMVLGIGCGLSVVHLGCLYARLYIPDAASCAVTGAGGALLVYAVVLDRLPGPWALVVAAALPLANAALTRFMAREWPTGTDFEDAMTFRDRSSEWPLFLYKVALPFFCIGIVLVALLSQLRQVLLPTFELAPTVAFLMSLAVSYVTVTCGIAGIRRHALAYTRLLSMIIPLVSLIAIPALNVDAVGASPANPSIVAALCVIVALAWTFLVSASLEYRLAPASVFSLGGGALALGAAAGGALYELLAAHAPWFFPVVALVCLVMCFGLIPAHPEKTLARATPDACDAAEQQETTAVPAPDAAVSAEEAAEAGQGQGHVEPARHVLDVDRHADGHNKGRFIRRCEYVAELYQLSPRELEVLILLAKGRSMSYVQEALVVSEGTAKTHIRHIYRKTNVHSRHELVGLIESIDVE